MARIAGVNIPVQKRVEISLQYIYGIGPTRAKEICQALQLIDSLRVKDLDEEQTVQIRKFIEDNYIIEGDLRREISMNIKRLKDLKCYRGIRHREGLPVRGQRTHSNARTNRKRRTK